MAARPARASAPAVTGYSTSHTHSAAALASLGFPFSHRTRLRQADGKAYTTFWFGPKSQRPEWQHIAPTCARQWRAGRLEVTHPFAIRMLAFENRRALIAMQQGQPHRIQALTGSGSRLTRLVPGPEDARILALPRELPLTDLHHAVALAGLGIPPIAITGSPGAHTYHLPRHAFTLRDAEGAPVLHDARLLVRLSPTPQDPRRLLLEATDPHHPFLQMVEALEARAELMTMVRAAAPTLLIESGGSLAEVSSQFTGRVMDHVAAILGTVPPAT